MTSSDSPSPPDRVLWSLRRRRTDVRCILRPASRPVEVLVLQDRDRVLQERFASEELALLWADAYAGRLRDLGWFDSPSNVVADGPGGNEPPARPDDPSAS